jgi:acetyl-CoA carboxylase carboxyl transferase subunit alpha
MNSKKLTAWDRVLLARKADRPKSLDYINLICDEFIEFHGDRLFSDDKSIVTGIGRIDNYIITIIGQQKGKTTKENMERNFGMTNPEGYRKALRMMKQAEKFNRPIITFVDTPGAYPGLGAEERGQGEAIARNLLEMSRLKTPIIAIVIGEGSSGGALGICVADKIVMLENAVYSVLSPEGFASILYKDASKHKEAAEHMKITANDLMELNVIDEIIQEPEGGAGENIEKVASEIKKYILNSLKELEKIDKKDLVNSRYEKYRRIK